MYIEPELEVPKNPKWQEQISQLLKQPHALFMVSNLIRYPAIGQMMSSNHMLILKYTDQI